MATPIVFLPGLLCNHTVFGPQTESLSPNYPTFVTELTQHDSVAALARQVLNEAPDRFTLIALSMGGYVAFEVLRQAMSRVEKLVLFDTSARPDDDATRRRRRGLIALSRQGRFKGVTQRLLPQLVHSSRLGDHALTNTIIDMASEIGREAYLRQQTAILGRPDSRPLLPSIACSTLVVCGREDVLTPLQRSREIAEAVPDGTLEIIEQAGHLVTLERPDAVNRILLRWLETTDEVRKTG